MRGILILNVGLLLASCAHKEGHDCPHHEKNRDHSGMSCEHNKGKGETSALAVMGALGKNKTAGRVKIFDNGSGLTLLITLSGLSPNATQGFHIHETGNCASADGSSAGGHFNPAGTPHGAPTDPAHHIGDLGNVTANAKGEVAAEVMMPGVRVKDIVGRAFILHAKADDLKSQPSGAAGDRVACGVIGYSP